MHAKYYDEPKKMDDSVKSVRNMRNKSIKNRSMMILLDLKDLQVQACGVWWKLQKYGLRSGIGNYPQECIVCHEPFHI